MARINRPGWIDIDGDRYDMPYVQMNYPNIYKKYTGNKVTLNAPITYRGNITYDNLPSSGNEIGDSYRLDGGNLVIWDGQDWKLIESVSYTAPPTLTAPGMSDTLPTITVSSISETVPTITAPSMSGTIPIEVTDNKKLSFEENLEKLEKRIKDLKYKETTDSIYDNFSDITKKLVDQETLLDNIQSAVKQLDGYSNYLYSNSNWGGNK